MTDSSPSKEVVRYCRGYGDMERDKYGTWVRYDDFERLQQDVARYESGRVVLTGQIDDLKQKLAYAEDAAAKGDLARQNAGGMDLLIETQRDKIQELEKKLSARLQQIEELRMAERHNVHTVAELQRERERDRLQRENQALRNLANNLRPGPISEALAGSMDEDYRRAGLPPNDALELSKSAVASIDWLRRKCGHDSKTVYGCEYCAAADLIESQSSTIFHISRAGDDLRRQITERDALTKSDPFANAPLTGPGSRLEADLREIRKRAVPDETLSGSKPELPDETGATRRMVDCSCKSTDVCVCQWTTPEIDCECACHHWMNKLSQSEGGRHAK